jgi:hypothetical protein
MLCKPPITVAFFTDSLEPSGVGEVISLLSQTFAADRYRQVLICPDTPAANLLVEQCPRAAAVYRLTVRDDGHIPELPVVATRDGGTPPQIRNGISGIFVPHENPPAVARELLRLIEQPELRARLGAALRKKVVAE